MFPPLDYLDGLFLNLDIDVGPISDLRLGMLSCGSDLEVLNERLSNEVMNWFMLALKFWQKFRIYWNPCTLPVVFSFSWLCPLSLFLLLWAIDLLLSAIESYLISFTEESLWVRNVCFDNPDIVGGAIAWWSFLSEPDPLLRTAVGTVSRGVLLVFSFFLLDLYQLTADDLQISLFSWVKSWAGSGRDSCSLISWTSLKAIWHAALALAPISIRFLADFEVTVVRADDFRSLCR